MHNSHETGEPLIAQIGVIILCQLIRFQLPFVHHSPATIPTLNLSILPMAAWLLHGKETQLKKNRDNYCHRHTKPGFKFRILKLGGKL